MTAETTPVSCAHEAYQGQCAHCGVPIVNGFPKYPAVQPAVWTFCPECGSNDIAHAEGDHKQCAGCGQEWFSDIDYSDVVQKNLARLYTYPAPHTLKVAVEALKKIRLQSEDCLSVRMETITAIADHALAALAHPPAQGSGWIVSNGNDDRWRAWDQGNPIWVDNPAKATRYARREDAEAVHAEDEDVWHVKLFEAAFSQKPGPAPRPLSAIRVDECEMSVRTTALAKRNFGNDVTLATLDARPNSALQHAGFTRKSIREIREVIETMRVGR